jgi:hypothetical protein
MSELLKTLPSIGHVPSQLADPKLFNKRQAKSYGLLQTCLVEVRDTFAKYNQAVTKATVIVSMIFAQSGKSEDVKYDRKLKLQLKTTIENQFPTMKNATVELILRAGRSPEFQSLLGIKPGTRTPDAAIKRYRKISENDGSQADHAMGWARAHPEILNKKKGTGNRVSGSEKSGSGLSVKGPDAELIQISLASQEAAKVCSKDLVDAFSKAGIKFIDVAKFESAARLVIGKLLDDHTDPKLPIITKKKKA